MLWVLLLALVFPVTWARILVQVKVITEIRKTENGDRIKVERTVKVSVSDIL